MPTVLAHASLLAPTSNPTALVGIAEQKSPSLTPIGPIRYGVRITEPVDREGGACRAPVPGLREGVSYVIQVRLKKGEDVGRALKRMKKILDKEGLMKQLRANRYFEKPSEKQRRKSARARARARARRSANP
jgi:small subunit ribosomal protein S21